MKKDRNKTEKKTLISKIRLLPTVILILLISGFIAYSNSFTSPFQWDDITQIVDQEAIRDLDNFLDVDAWKKINQRPVSQLTFAINYSVGGLQVTGYHIINLLLHILTAFLVFLLARLLMLQVVKDERYDQRMRDGIALIIAMVFLVHPLQTMAVTYIVQRMTVLAALFYILAVYLYIIGRNKYLSGGN